MTGSAEGKVVLVTGAASGMGRSGARIFAREGAAHVYVADVNDGSKTVAEIHSAGGAATFLAVDVTDEAVVSEMIDRIVDERGRLDCAWNNAGINDISRPFHELELSSWDRMIAINLTSV